MIPTLFLDIDDTLLSHTPLARDFILDQYGLELPQDFHSGYDLFGMVEAHLSPERKLLKYDFWAHYTDNFLLSRDPRYKHEPLPGATETVAALSCKYDLWVVTARPCICKEVTEDTLDQFFPNCFQGIHFVWKREGGKHTERPKRDFITEIGSGLALIDDNPEQIIAAQSAIEPVLFDPHDHHRNHPEIKVRVKSWSDIADRFL
ncbi:MAG: hypothetical protein RL150_266 [Candidatus Parcubacteria bacterium]